MELLSKDLPDDKMDQSDKLLCIKSTMDINKYNIMDACAERHTAVQQLDNCSKREAQASAQVQALDVDMSTVANLSTEINKEDESLAKDLADLEEDCKKAAANNRNAHMGAVSALQNNLQDYVLKRSLLQNNCANLL